MKVSIVKKNINPTLPSYLSGQINRISKHTGILDDIYCTGMILELSETKLCLLSYDLLQFDSSLSDQIRSSVSSAINLDKNYVFTIPSHTHAAPEVLIDGLFGIKTESTVTEGYLDFLVETSVDVANRANQSLIDCYAEYAEVEIEGYYGNRNNKDKPSDKTIRFLQFINNGNIVGILVNLSCHPTILGAQNTLISSDLIGVIRKGLTNRYQCPVIMTNGAEGDISNRHYRQTSDESELLRTGIGILNQIPNILESKRLDIAILEVHSQKFVFKCFNDIQRIQSAIDQNVIRLNETDNVDTLKLLNATNTVLYHRLNTKIEPEMEIEYSIIYLGSIFIVSVPMELFSSLFLKIKDQVDIPIILLGLTNTSIGYCVDCESYEDTYEGLTSPFIKGEGERFIESIVDEIIQIHRK